MKAIYTNFEDDKIIDELKKRDPTFNLSEFVRKCLRDEVGKNFGLRNKEEVEEELKMLQKNFSEMKELKKQLEEEIEKINEEEQEILRAGREIKEKEKLRLQERKKTFIEWISYYDVPKEEINGLAEEFAHTNDTLNEFLERKGYKTKGGENDNNLEMDK